MPAYLTVIKGALADISDAGLRALAAATCEVPQIAPGLLAWLDQAYDWEWNRRAGYDYALQPPEAAIPPEEDEVSIEAVYAMRASFTADDMPPAMIKFFDALVDLLTGRGRKQ